MYTIKTVCYCKELKKKLLNKSKIFKNNKVFIILNNKEPHSGEKQNFMVNLSNLLKTLNYLKVS